MFLYSFQLTKFGRKIVRPKKRINIEESITVIFFNLFYSPQKTPSKKYCLIADINSYIPFNYIKNISL